MSHFTVLVVGDDIDKQLEPFFEQGDEGDYFMEFEPEVESREELIASWKRHNAEIEAIPAQERSSYHQTYDTPEEYAEKYHGWIERDGQWGYISNPRAKWDWYVVGGRWSGSLKYKEGGVGTMGHHRGTGAEIAKMKNPGDWDEETKRQVANRLCDSCTVGDLDIEGMKQEAIEAANDKYESFEAAVGLEGAPLPFSEFRKDYPDGDDGLKAARDSYGSIEWVKKYEAAQKEDKVPFLFLGDAVEFFCCHNGGREEFVRRAAAESFSTYAVLKDDVWYEKGEMGWFGISTNEVEDWQSEFLDLVGTLPADTTITVVDCHI